MMQGNQMLTSRRLGGLVLLIACMTELKEKGAFLSSNNLQVAAKVTNKQIIFGPCVHTDTFSLF